MVFLKINLAQSVGSSPSAWSNANLISIGSLWGSDRGFNERTVRSRHFGVARILIDTKIEDPIVGHVALTLDGSSCDAGVKEVPVCPSVR